jgi:sarcosine oxidase subunit alpha
MTQDNRIAGGLIDRGAALAFTFDGKRYGGHGGDTLASALLANGVRLMGRSFKYHRPRGPISAGSEEPNALVELRAGARREPNTRATVAELYDGLTARSQNHVGSLSRDWMAVADLVAPLLAAGFYYKTFMWPKAFWERVYEPMIRRAAGLGALSMAADPDRYDKGFRHCDLLIVGAGPAGLAAALTAGRAGAAVILADEDFILGGRLNAETFSIGAQSGGDWAAGAAAELTSLANVRVMARTTVIGVFDGGVCGALERNADHLPAPPAGKPRQTFWRIYAKRTLVCAGATERPIAFRDNDRPGVMLAGALRAYANRWAVAAGRKVAIFTNNDDGHRTARDLADKGIDIAAVIDTRPDAPRSARHPVHAGAVVTRAYGRLALHSVDVRLASGEARRLACDALGVSGGWSPNVQLTCHQGARPIWDDALVAFVPGRSLPAGLSVAGAAGGLFSTCQALASGARAAADALARLGIAANPIPLRHADDAPTRQSAFFHVPGKGRAWVDLQNDVTVKDVQLAHQEGYVAVEHLKRYTTLGMATDQGKTANVLGLAAMAEITGKTIAQTGTTIFRPPCTPVTIAALAGRATARNFRPMRLTPSHSWAQARGAVFVDAGLWRRSQHFPKPGETRWRQSVDREVRATRTAVGICDVSSLGKIDVQGVDAGAFLNRIHANAMAKLPVGKIRYGLMLREDGHVMDDGTAARLAADHFVVTTTTGNAAGVYRHMEFCRQCLWPGLDVQIISTTDAWAQFSVAGPQARALLARIVDPGVSLTSDAFPFMACAEITICGGLRARLFRISFSGELAYEVAVPARYGGALFARLAGGAEEMGGAVYGVEALGVMRIEKGHPAGPELNGTATAPALGMGGMVSKKKDAIGSVLSEREEMIRPDGPALMGFRPVDRTRDFAAGSHFIALGAQATAANDEGHMTSACHSPTLGHAIGLGFLRGGRDRLGEVLRAVNPLEGCETMVEVVNPCFVDPEGGRLRV